MLALIRPVDPLGTTTPSSLGRRGVRTAGPFGFGHPGARRDGEGRITSVSFVGYHHPVLIRVSQDIRTDHHELRRLIRWAFHGVDVSALEIHLEPLRRRRESFTGLAYFQLPTRPRTEPGTRYLVRLRLPRALRNRDYPKTYRYPGRRTAPWITVGDWRERLLALAAHEACHIWQFRGGHRRSEVQAERWAAGRLLEWRRLDSMGNRAASPGDGVARPLRRWDRQERGLKAQLALF
jgi:hypothetical protein